MKINSLSILVIITLSILAISCEAEINIGNTEMQYQKFYGGAFTEEIAAVHMQDDGSQIVLGSNLSNDLSVTSYYLFMTDPYGEIQWSQEIGANNMAIASDMIVENDQIITVGHMTMSTGDQDLILWKTNMEGEFLGSLSLGTLDRNEVSPKIISLTDQSAYIIASHVVEGDVIVDNLVYYIDSQSYAISWEASYSVFSQNANVVGLQQASDDRIIWIGSEVDNEDFDDTVISINLLNIAGSKISTTQIGLNDGQQDKAYSLKKNGSTFLIAGSTTDSNDEDHLKKGIIIPFSYNISITVGDIITANRGDISYELLDVVLTPQNDYYVTGYEQIGTEDRDIYISQWSRQGTESWAKTYGGSGLDVGKHINYNTDNDAILVYGTANLSTNQSITILQTDGNGSLVTNK